MRAVLILGGVAGAGFVLHVALERLARHQGWEPWEAWVVAGVVFALTTCLAVSLRPWSGARRRRLGYRLRDLDALSGEEFERWISAVLRAAGFAVKRVSRARDYGVDLIVERGGRRIGIEAKRRSATIPNAVVRSVVSGCQYHACDDAAVVTQSHFSREARQQAERASIPVVLVDRDDLGGLARRLRRACR